MAVMIPALPDILTPVAVIIPVALNPVAVTPIPRNPVTEVETPAVVAKVAMPALTASVAIPAEVAKVAMPALTASVAIPATVENPEEVAKLVASTVTVARPADTVLIVIPVLKLIVCAVPTLVPLLLTPIQYLQHLH